MCMEYNYDSHSRTYYVSLEQGDKIMESLKTLAVEKGIRYAAIISGIGSAEDLSFMNECGKYGAGSLCRQIKGVFNVNSMQGTILMQDGERTPHVHITSNNGDSREDGHLIEGTCVSPMEIVLSYAPNAFFKREKTPNKKSTRIISERITPAG